MARVLINESITDAGLDCLRAAGHQVDIRSGLSGGDLAEALQGAQALIVRSATQVTAEVLDAVDGLVVVGRAGIGLDNIDVRAATRRGVMVVNAPMSNSVSAAEHAMALLLAQARNVPQAHADLVGGSWDRSRWQGVELADKTLGIVGLGRIGRMVAERAKAFGMRVIAHDPYVAQEYADRIDVELCPLEGLMGRSDFVSLHLARTPETVGLIDAGLLSLAKPGIRIVNAARGGIVDEEALAAAIVSGQVGGAAFDVFATEPTTESPLFGLPQVVVTPHLGASTTEAQDKAGVIIAEQVDLALAGEYVPFAVNVEAEAASKEIRPFIPLAQTLGAVFGLLPGSLPECLDVEFRGEIGTHDNSMATLAVVKGLLDHVSAEAVTFVNAMDMARERGLEVRAISVAAPRDYLNTITLRSASHSLAGTVVGLHGEPRIVMVDEHSVDVPWSDHMLIARSFNRPGVIGVMGSALGDAGVNIGNMDVGQSDDGETMLMVLATDSSVPGDVLDELRGHQDILSADRLDLA